MTPEGLIKTAICYYLLSRKDIIRIFWTNDSVGIFDPVKKIYRKNNSPFHLNGVSDVVGMFHGGRWLAIEVKSAKGRLSPEQRIFLEEINHGGGLAFMARSVDDVRKNLPCKQTGTTSE